eukprot:scaffold131640_cov26-Tisochrysis_lutea.AAC.1
MRVSHWQVSRPTGRCMQDTSMLDLCALTGFSNGSLVRPRLVRTEKCSSAPHREHRQVAMIHDIHISPRVWSSPYP